MPAEKERIVISLINKGDYIFTGTCDTCTTHVQQDTCMHGCPCTLMHACTLAHTKFFLCVCAHIYIYL